MRNLENKLKRIYKSRFYKLIELNCINVETFYGETQRQKKFFLCGRDYLDINKMIVITSHLIWQQK